MKIEYALRINALKKYQPSMEEIRAAVVELVWQKVEADKHRVEAGDFEVAIFDVPGWVDESLTAARRHANRLQVRLGKLTITAAKNLKDKGYSNAAIASALAMLPLAGRYSKCATLNSRRPSWTTISSISSISITWLKPACSKANFRLGSCRAPLVVLGTIMFFTL